MTKSIGFQQFINRIFEFFFQDTFKNRLENITLYLGIGGFVIHLLLIYATQAEFIALKSLPEEIFKSPISAIYTPFSFILIYEVYLLIYYLPRSFTSSVEKQYEIVGLIVIRRIFKDIGKLNLENNFLDYADNMHLIFDIVGFLLLFLLIYFFNLLIKQKPTSEPSDRTEAFITIKKLFSIILLPVMFGLAIYSLISWLLEIRQFNLGEIEKLSNVNNVFYYDFFAILIVVDVLILIISFKYTVKHSQLIRNSGFVISTILIRLSFSIEGVANMGIILFSVLFGVLILMLYNMLERLDKKYAA